MVARCAVAAALCVGGLAALGADAGRNASQGPQLQEIVVTATRREESLSKVPVSVTAVTQDALDQKGIKDFHDIVRFTPGVSIDNSGTSAISIRGISSSGGALIDINGIHLPAGFAGYATPNVIMNKQETWTQEVRLQSNPDSTRWKWTLGGFWSLSKETSIEELKDPNIIPFWQALFGIDPQTYFGPYYYCNGQGTPGQSLPDCDIYINHNIVHDRQLAGFGELTYAFNEQWSLTLGGRYAKLSFDLAHHGDGLENYGPDAFVGMGGCTAQPCFKTATQSEHSFTPKVNVSFQANPNNLFYATYAKGFRPGGGNAPLPAYCNGTGGLDQVGYPNGAPLTYKSDTTRSFEVGSKNNLGGAFRIATSAYYIKWSGIQQNVYVGYNCGLQFTDNLGTAVAKGFDIQAEMALGAGFSAEAAVGYTSARYTESTPPPKPLLVQSGDAISGEAAIDGSPGTNPPCLRHSLAMTLLHAGADRSVIALFLGHEQVETTSVYLHADMQLKEAALATISATESKVRRYRPGDRLLAFLNGL